MRAAVYARVSGAEQARPDATSISQQLERGRAYAVSQAWEVVAEFRDEGISGAKALKDRPEGRRLLARAGRDFDVAIFWSVDRFTRSAGKGLRDFEVVEAQGCNIVFVKEAVDTSTPAGRLFRTMLAAFAQFEREQIRDRSMSGRYGAAQRGRWPSGRVPHGYEWDAEKAELVLNESQAEGIRHAFRLRAEGVTYREMVERLESLGYEPPLDRWTHQGLQKMVKNPIYKGDGHTTYLAPAQGAEREAFHYPAPAIVSETIWGAAQPAKGNWAPNQRRNRYPLGGRVHHIHTDGTTATMYGRYRDRLGRRYYTCTASKDGKCPERWVSVRANEVEEEVLRILTRVAEESQSKSAIKLEVEGWEAEGVIERLAEAIHAAEARKERWKEMYVKEIISWDELEARLQATQEEIDDLTERIQQKEVRLSELVDVEPTGDLIALLEVFDAKVLVHESGVDVTFAYSQTESRGAPNRRNSSEEKAEVVQYPATRDRGALKLPLTSMNRLRATLDRVDNRLRLCHD